MKKHLLWNPLIPIVSAVFLAACGGGSGSADTPPDQQAQAVTTELTCVVDASVATPWGRLHNNTWNSQAAGNQSWRQCLLQRDEGGSREYGWSWQWPINTTEVLSYPSLVLGAKPWDDAPNNDPRFPRPLASLNRLQVAWEVDTVASGSFNLALSLWLINTPSGASPPDERAITTEIMVWTRAEGSDWSGGTPPLAVVTIDGITWEVYAQTNWADASGASSHRWTHVTYEATRRIDKVDIDVYKILADAHSRGLVSASDHLANLELGNEVSAGSGTTWLKSFSVTIE
jgi:hypothetical protein